MKKSILFYTENWDKGGGNKYLIDFINCLEETEYEILLVSNKGGLFRDELDSVNKDIEYEQTKIYTFSSIARKLKVRNKFSRRLILLPIYIIAPIFYIVNILIFMRLLSRFNPVIVHSFNGGYPAARSCLAIVVAAKLKKITTILNIVSIPQRTSSINCLSERLRDWLICRCADHIIVNAAAIKKAMIENRKFKPEAFHVIYNGLTTTMNNDSEGFCKKFGIDKNKNVIIGYVSRIEYMKGPTYLIDAFILISDEYPNTLLVMVGHGKDFNSIKSRVTELNIQDKVIFTDYYSGNIFDVLCSFDIFVFPSLHEGFPYSVIEAMKAGCPIISTNVGGISEAISNGVEGMLVRPRDSEVIANRIRLLMSNSEVRKSLSKNAKNRFNKQFSLQKMRSKVNHVYSFITSGLTRRNI